MAGILYDASKIKVYAVLENLCDYVGTDDSVKDKLWQEFLVDEELYQEFVYYVENHTIQGIMNVHGYTLIDLFVMEMDVYNMTHDTGKNTALCNKEEMVLRAFLTMIGLKKEPEKYIERFQNGMGNDRL